MWHSSPTTAATVSTRKPKLVPASLVPWRPRADCLAQLVGTLAARGPLENSWPTTSLKAVVCAVRFAIESQAYRSPKASVIADRAGLPLARRRLHGSWLSVMISLL
jgi:hypothetical protein